MEIKVASALGAGKTELSAFDNALVNCGVANYNLLSLSSIIPQGASIKRVEKYITPPDEFGHRLYVVKAEQRSVEPGSCIVAGIGWYLLPDEAKGFFVEFESCGEDEALLRRDLESSIRNSLGDLCSFRGLAFDVSRVETEIVSGKVGAEPLCALVLAVFKSEAW